MRSETTTSGLRVHGHGSNRVVLVRFREIDIWIEGLVTEDLLRARVQEFAADVGLGIAAAMGVDDVHVCGASGEEAIDDRIEVGREQFLSLGILLGMAEEERAPVVLSGETLHVMVDE